MQNILILTTLLLFILWKHLHSKDSILYTGFEKHSAARQLPHADYHWTDSESTFAQRLLLAHSCQKQTASLYFTLILIAAMWWCSIAFLARAFSQTAGSTNILFMMRAELQCVYPEKSGQVHKQNFSLRCTARWQHNKAWNRFLAW